MQYSFYRKTDPSYKLMISILQQNDVPYKMSLRISDRRFSGKPTEDPSEGRVPDQLMVHTKRSNARGTKEINDKRR